MSAQVQTAPAVKDQSAEINSATAQSVPATKKMPASMPVEKNQYVLSELTNHVRKYSPVAFDSLPTIPSYTFTRIHYVDEDGLRQEDEFLEVGFNSFHNNKNVVWALAKADDVTFYKQRTPKSPLSRMQGDNRNQIRFNVPFDYIRNLKEPGGNKVRDQARSDKRKRRDIFIQYVFMATGRLYAINNTIKEYTNVLGFFAKACEDVLRGERHTYPVNSRKGSEKDPLGEDTTGDDTLEGITVEGDTIDVKGNTDEQQGESSSDSEITAAPAPAPVPTKRKGAEKRKRKAEEEGDVEQGGESKAKRLSEHGQEKLTLKLTGNKRTNSTANLLATGFRAIESVVQDLTNKLGGAETDNEDLKAENSHLRKILSTMKAELAEAKRAASEADDDELADVKLELVEVEQAAKDAVKEAQDWKDKYDTLKTSLAGVEASIEAMKAIK
ncbi:hypothetical protein K491DRAFT_784870 [Lophiostoma macrostomum CBS 122681]|uniref:Uncharacterized protein n=1 Tax=Lophiostoma macrostomum CBS 122681 TaxID=1314788 RepID=A0A6A6SH50_9PLEO|nr:hypothetical protein K491DRAFT_784870 [Lophiostoma macrostomum CBS 122681]